MIDKVVYENENRVTRILIIDKNSFYSAIPGLLSLKLSSNRLHILNDHFLISNSLMYLDLRNCSITQIDKKAFENITSLNTLDISMNTLTKLDTEIFDSLISLEILEMNDCNLTNLNENLFRNLSNLKTLKMNGNNFQSVTNWFLMFAFLKRLEHLELKSSKLQFLSKKSISEISYLRTLKLSDNYLKNVNFNEILGKNLQNLEVLDLSDCHLNQNFTKDSFRNIDQLRELNLSGNNQVDNISEILKYLTNLEKLILRNAGLKRLPNVFHDLVELDVSYNHLDNNFTATLVDFDKLQYLNMAYCNLTLISANTFRKMSSMTHLILSGNNLKSLGFDLFLTLPYLESLELNNCQFEGPLNGKLALFENHVPFTHLKQLYLSKNPLKITDNDGPLLPKQFSRLELLDISYCNISFLPKNAFSLTPNITKLKLNGNKLNSNQNNSFDYLMFLPHLEELDLTNNRLKTFFHHKIQNKSRITKLTFFDNPWNCGLFICDLFQWLKKQDQNLFAFQMHPKNLSCYNS